MKQMKVIAKFTPIITMLSRVTFDLLEFLFFFLIQNFLFSLMFCVLEIANLEKKEGVFYEKFNPVFNRNNEEYE